MANRNKKDKVGKVSGASLEEAAERASSSYQPGRSAEGDRTGSSGSRKNSSQRRSDGYSNNRSERKDPVRTTAGSGRGSVSHVYPSNSAAANAFGSFNIFPGQDNAIADWSRIMNYVGSDRPAWTATTTFSSYAKRSANAMCIDFCPYFGAMLPNATNTYMAPLRQASLKLKQFIDTSFGTRTDYDPADLGGYVLACAALWTQAAEIRRDLRLTVTSVVHQFPQFLPRGLFAMLRLTDGSGDYALGEGWEWTTRNLRVLIDEYNRLVTLMNALPMPREMEIFGYNDDLFDALWADSEDLASAQLYLFRTPFYWKYDEESTLGATVKLMDWDQPLNLNQKMQLWKQAIEAVTALQTSSSAMLQNLFNAFGTRELATLAYIPITGPDPLPILHDEHVLMMIENMNWGSLGTEEGVRISDIQVLSADSSFNAHVWTGQMGWARWFNLPLQFHKPFDQVTTDDKGWALRMHPCFLSCKHFETYRTIENAVEVTDEETGEVRQVLESQTLTEGHDGVVADGYVGFAIPGTIRVASFNDDGSFDIQTWSNREAGSGGSFYDSVFTDFKHHPMFVGGEVSYDAQSNPSARLLYYVADRDVESTYRLDDVQMIWNYMTEDVLAGNIQRETLGTRKLTRN